MTGSRSYSRHGLNALKARVKVHGLSAIDRRTVGAQALVAWRNQLLRDLGGEETVSAQQMALVEMAVRTRLYIDSLDAWLMEQKSLVNRRRKAVLPVVKERQQLVDSLARILGQLGIERRAKPIPRLREYLEEKYQISDNNPVKCDDKQEEGPDNPGGDDGPGAVRAVVQG